MPFLRDKLTILSIKGEECQYIVSQCEWGMDQGSKFLKGIP